VEAADLPPVAEPVSVGVPLAGIRVEAAYLGAVPQTVAIGVGPLWVCTDAELAAVSQVVAVGIALAVGLGGREVVPAFPAIGQSIVIAIARGGRARRRGDVAQRDYG
jgi:hypothetical protein